MKFILSLLITTTAILANAQTSGKQAEFNSVWGIDYNSNMVKQPSAQKNVKDVVLNGGATATRDTGVGDRIDNIASYEFVLPAMASVEILLNPPNDDQTSGNCGGSGEFKTSTAGLVAEITNGTSDRLSFVTLPSSSGWRSFKIPQVPCAASGARRMFIGNPTGSSITVNVGKLYYGRMEPGAGVPPNTFTAAIQSDGTVSGETPEDWISGNCTNAAPSVCTFTSAKFTSTPNCQITTDKFSGAVAVPNIGGLTASGVSLYGTNASGTVTATNYWLSCTKTGSDYIQPAITPNQWDFKEKSYSPAFQNAPTMSSPAFSYSRSGGMMSVFGSFTATAAGSAGYFAVDLPSGFTSTDLTKVGKLFWVDNGTANFVGSVGFLDNNTLRFFVNAAGSNMLGSAFANGDIFNFDIEFPAAENGVPWTENQGAPQLVGSVTSNSSNALRVVSFAFNKSGGVCNSSPCDVTSSTDPITVTRSGQGTYPTNVKSYFNGASQCFANNSGAINNKCLINGAGTVYCTVTSTGGTIDEAADVFCIGPR